MKKNVIWGVIVILVIILLFVLKPIAKSGPLDVTVPWPKSTRHVELFELYAKDLGLDVEKFKSDYASDEIYERVMTDSSDAISAGIKSTPTILINGKQVSNEDRRYEGIRKLLNAELASPSTHTGLIPALRESDHTLGLAGSKVVLYEYSDFECSACLSFLPVMQTLETEFDDRVLFVYRHLPLYPQPHPKSIDAAKASEAASKQGKFWEMHDKLFENQQ